MSTYGPIDDHRFTQNTIRAVPCDQQPPLPQTPEQPWGRASGSGLATMCYCSKHAEPQSGLYCSLDCARNDAFSSLTHARPGSAISSRLSYASDSLSSSRAPSSASDYDDASHYRRMARADQRREELREERRRRRAEGSSSPISSRALSMVSSLSSHGCVPDLVSSHSRNTSNASSIFSLATSGSLSRNTSSASSRQYTASVVVDDAIMEDMEVDHEEVLDSVHERAVERNSNRETLKARRARQLKAAAPTSDLAVGDMYSVLDEIINMEQSFQVQDEQSKVPTPVTPVFVPAPDRPPRTPSPVMGNRDRSSTIPDAPHAPDRRNSLVHTRPPSMYAHQVSLSESHTALYLATASPLPPSKGRHRRSASPNLNIRRSISFTPQAAGPALPPPPRNRYDSPGLTPVRRKHLTPNAYHPAMTGWRFPNSSPAVSPHATPTREAFEQAEPQLLWPQKQPGNDNLAPALFEPTERAPDFSAQSSGFSPPRSALRLGAFLNSGGGDDDDASTIRGSVRDSTLSVPAPPFAQPGW